MAHFSLDRKHYSVEYSKTYCSVKAYLVAHDNVIFIGSVLVKWVNAEP
jgi:hypothetical protein